MRKGNSGNQSGIRFFPEMKFAGIKSIGLDVIGITFLAGIIIHLFFLANHYVNHDSVALYSNNLDWLLSQGKWFVTPLAALDGPINITYLSGLIGILAMSLAAYFFCEVFDLNKKWEKLIVGVSFVSFPMVAACFLYQGIDYFGLTFLLAIMSAYFIIKGKSILAKITGILLLVLSIGAYQAYLGATVAIMVLHCLLLAINNQGWKKIVTRGLGYCVYVLLSIGIYYLILKILLHYTNTDLSSYKGIDNMAANLSPAIMINSMIQAWKDVYTYCILNGFGVLFRMTSWLHIGFFVLYISLVFIKAKKSGAINHISNVIIIVLLLLCMPVAVNIIGILAANQTFYYISIAPFILLFVAPLTLFPEEGNDETEQIFTSGEKKWTATRLISILLVMLILVSCVDWISQDNIVYQKIALMNKEFDAKFAILISRIQATKGYNEETKVAFVGNPPYDFLASSGLLNAMEAKMTTNAFGLHGSADMIYSEGILSAYLGNALSISVNQVSQSEVDNRELIERMPVYPYDGSIELSNDVLIVKLSNNT